MADKPAEILNDDYQKKLYARIFSDPEPRETFTILHVSDIHVDMDYAEGSLAKCDGYLCCRAENGFPTDPSLAAGKWGGYLCDMPMITLQSMLSHIVETHGDDIQSIFWTGDNSPHNVWENTVEEVSYYNKLVTQEIKDAFAGMGIPIYASTGNHDTWPVNLMDFTAPYTNQPINDLVDTWTEWMGE